MSGVKPAKFYSKGWCLYQKPCHPSVLMGSNEKRVGKGFLDNHWCVFSKFSFFKWTETSAVQPWMFKHWWSQGGCTLPMQIEPRCVRRVTCGDREILMPLYKVLVRYLEMELQCTAERLWKLSGVQAGSVWDGELVGQERIMKEDRSQNEPRAERELMLAGYSGVRRQWGQQLLPHNLIRILERPTRQSREQGRAGWVRRAILWWRAWGTGIGPEPR